MPPQSHCAFIVPSYVKNTVDVCTAVCASAALSEINWQTCGKLLPESLLPSLSEFNQREHVMSPIPRAQRVVDRGRRPVDGDWLGYRSHSHGNHDHRPAVDTRCFLIAAYAMPFGQRQCARASDWKF